jgi:NADH dehydrogenase
MAVHAMLMTGVRTRLEAFIDWFWTLFSKTRGPQVLDRASAARIDWSAGAGPAADKEPVEASRSPAAH